MGREAECTVRVGRKRSPGTAHLESGTLAFRGEFRLDIPLDTIREVSVRGDALVVVDGHREARFELGEALADRWMRAIRQPKGLFEKLEVGPHSRVAVVDVDDPPFLTALRERAATLAEGRVPDGAPVIFFGAKTREALRKIQLLRARMIDAGVLWIVRPKGTSAISEADVFNALRGAGLVDTKVVAFSKTHTAHKCVVPLELRGRAVRRAPIVSVPPSSPLLLGNLAPTKPKGASAAAKKRSSKEKAKAR